MVFCRYIAFCGMFLVQDMHRPCPIKQAQAGLYQTGKYGPMFYKLSFNNQAVWQHVPPVAQR
ncbi:hypothetical protein ApDm4_0394 [Acetobacter pomorum]|nr:hypothetical protein ApDm4_0394 [Acetobacter pomorum]